MQENEQQENNDKIEKQFAATMRKLAAICGGDNQLKPVRKVPNNEMADLVEELFKEEREELIAGTKTKLKDLLKQYHEMTKAFIAKEKELEKLKQEKKKEFTKAANDLFNKVENVGDIERSYYQGLREVAADQAVEVPEIKE